MTNEAFEDGRRHEGLRVQIEACCWEIVKGSGKNDPHQRARLRKGALPKVFNEYLDLSAKYMVPASKEEKLYNEAMGISFDRSTFP